LLSVDTVTTEVGLVGLPFLNTPLHDAPITPALVLPFGLEAGDVIEGFSAGGLPLAGLLTARSGCPFFPLPRFRFFFFFAEPGGAELPVAVLLPILSTSSFECASFVKSDDADDITPVVATPGACDNVREPVLDALELVPIAESVPDSKFQAVSPVRGWPLLEAG